MTKRIVVVLVGLISLLWVSAELSCTRPEQPKSEPRHTAPISQKSAASVVVPFAITSSDVSMPHPQLRIPQSSDSLDVPARNAILAWLNRTRKGGRDQIDYRIPKPADLGAYALGLRSLLGRAALGEIPVDLVLEGFRLEPLTAQYVALSEAPDRRQGAAAVVLRANGSHPLAIEVPHSFFDEGTLPIGLNLFLIARARLLLVNTVHRYRTTGGRPPGRGAVDGDEGQSAESDVAHSPHSFFLTAHEAFLDEGGGGLVVQIHGFSDASAAGADAVISAARTSALVEPIAERLRKAMNVRVLVYPKDTRKLGGTRNVQAQASLARGQRFIHIELSQSFRQRLLESESLATEFALAVASEAR